MVLNGSVMFSHILILGAESDLMKSSCLHTEPTPQILFEVNIISIYLNEIVSVPVEIFLQKHNEAVARGSAK